MCWYVSVCVDILCVWILFLLFVILFFVCVCVCVHISYNYVSLVAQCLWLPLCMSSHVVLHESEAV